MSYKMHFGDFDLAMKVCHRCDNPACVNPDHLFLATQKANMLDMVSKKRHGRGQRDVPSYDHWLEQRPNKSKEDVCRRGHKFSDENTRMKHNARFIVRVCRQCQSETAKKDLVEYKVKGFVRHVNDRPKVVEEIVDKVKRLGVKCAYCDGKFECLDHIVPKARGGETSADNVNPSCNKCNQERKSLLW